MKKIAFFVLCLCLFATDASAVRQQTEHGFAEFFAHDSDDSITIELKIKPKKGWYFHSHQPGEFGLPAKAEWDLGNYKLVSEEWSEGEDILYQGFGLNVYKTEGLYRAVLEKSHGMTPALDVFWMACGNECVPEKMHFELIPEAFVKKNFSPVEKNQKQNDFALPMWLKAALMAFIGGFILNLMPCVFPVLFIKVIGLMQQKENFRRRADALAYFSGVVLCFVIMSAILQFLKSRGQALGWGFQLQSPYFVAFMAIVFLLLAFMFLDVLKVNFAWKKMPAGSFLTGLLAVLIASPCAAPFMGAAVGWSLTSDISGYEFYGVFVALGVGYALPFFMAELFPKFMQRVLPRPGKWMLWLKRFFAVPMFMTALWLLWILFGLESSSKADWQPYNREKIEQLVESGEKVFVDFTAKWCLTCLANEKVVLNSDGFAQLVKEKKIHLFKADWTMQNKNITEALAAFGRSSVPMYVYYGGKGNYVILPQILTVDIIKEKMR